MHSHQSPAKAKIKSAAILLGLGIVGFGIFRHMTQFPEPGAVGQPIPDPYDPETRQVAERLEMDLIWLCQDIGRRTSRFSVKTVQLREGLERNLLDGGFQLENLSYKVGTSTYHSVVGVREGQGQGTILIGTHHDSYGKSVCANASGTGVATVMETVRALRNETLDPTVIVAFFATGEEPHTGRDTMGAQVWLDAQEEAGRTIDAAYIVGSFGCFRAGDVGQNSAFPWYLSHPESMDWVGVYGPFLGGDMVEETLAVWGGVTDLPARGFASPHWMMGVPDGDHIPFQKAGIPCVLFSDTGGNRDTSLRTSFDLPYVLDFKEMARRVQGFTASMKAITTKPLAAEAESVADAR